MRDKSAITTITSTIEVASGVFAPGHLGELTQYIPFELVDAVLEDTCRKEQRLRDLPSRVGVYWLLALGLWAHLGYRQVWDKMTRALSALPVPDPSEKALRDLRRRLTPAPFKALFEVLAGPLAQPTTPGVRYRGRRTVAFDGCSSIKTADSARNRSWLGKIKYRLGWAGYPQLMLMTLAETGTRGLIGAVFGPASGSKSTGEIAYAAKLTHLLNDSMLLLLDRGFDSNDLFATVAATGAQFLARLKSTRRPPIVAKLPDGSYLSRLGRVTVRIIEADLIIRLADGTVVSGRYRLATTLLDHQRDPAAALIRLYHERWEIESAYYALRHTLLKGRVLRSGDPVGIEQELWALLVLYQALRTAMVTAAESVPGTDPDRAGFTIALECARDTVNAARAILPATTPDGKIDLVGHIGHAILDDLLPPRRPRISARKVKCPISRYHAQPADDDRPLATTTITEIGITIRDLEPVPVPTPRPPTRRPRRAQQPDPAAPEPHANQPRTRKDRILALLNADPGRAWHARDLARELGAADPNSFATQVSAMARQGLIRKISRATYTMTHPLHLRIPRPRPPHVTESTHLTLTSKP